MKLFYISFLLNQAPSHTIVPVAIESLGVIGPISMAFLKDLSRKNKAVFWGGEGPPVPPVLSSVGELSGPDIFLRSACNIFFCLCFV